jgi:hypothetical protein
MKVYVALILVVDGLSNIKAVPAAVTIEKRTVNFTMYPLSTIVVKVTQ